MAVVATLNTFADGTRMDSITKGIVNIDPVDTPVTSNRKVEKMTNTVHETYFDGLYNVTSSHTVYEGSDTAAYWNEAPTTLYFIAEGLRSTYRITKTRHNVVGKTGQNPLAREREKAGKMMKKILEERAILSTQASGASGTARQMKGLVSQLATYTDTNATIAFTESGVNSQLIDAWDRGAEIDELFLPMQLKRKASAWTGVATVVNTDVQDKRIVSAKNLYESDATNLMKLMKSRVLTDFMSAGAASSAERSLYFGVEGSKVKLGLLGGVDLEEMKPDADKDSYRGKLQAEWTVMLTNPKAGFVGVNRI